MKLIAYTKTKERAISFAQEIIEEIITKQKPKNKLIIKEIKKNDPYGFIITIKEIKNDND